MVLPVSAPRHAAHPAAVKKPSDQHGSQLPSVEVIRAQRQQAAAPVQSASNRSTAGKVTMGHRTIV